jgi:hypothetical protein
MTVGGGNKKKEEQGQEIMMKLKTMKRKQKDQVQIPTDPHVGNERARQGKPEKLTNKTRTVASICFPLSRAKPC